jgi:tetratricopeptide (TPR) repeat protein
VAAASPLLAADGSRLDTSENLFTVLAALNAAGYDADLGSTHNSPIRNTVREMLAKENIPVLADIRAFYKANPNLGPYLSLALSTTPPPEFTFNTRTVDIPPDAAAMDKFLPLLNAFYDQAHINAIWNRLQPAYNAALEPYSQPVSQATLLVNSYFRSPAAGYLGRRFVIYIDLLAAPGQVHSRSYGDNYFVIATPSAEPRIAELRHAYLHFLVEPLVAKYGLVLMKKASLSDFAAPAPMLDDSYKNDFVLLVSECLIKAVESRLDRKPDFVAQSLHEGFVLTPFFAEQLVAYEKQPTAMRLHFPEMLDALDRDHERKRLENVTFTAKPKSDKPVAAAEKPVALSVSARTSEQGEMLYQAQQYEQARTTFLKALEQQGSVADHGLAYYGLARLALRANNPDLAEQLFKKVLETDPTPQNQGWALVYLGRLADLSGDRKEAVRRYQEALNITGVSDQARKAAEKGAQDTFKK